MKTLRIFISGKVQAVGFRFFAKSFAEKFNIKGFVQNMPNGDVLVVAQGKNTNLFLEVIRKGPPYSKVTNIVVMNTNEKEYVGFEIL
ncbi:MAG: acylphosphatase [Candidatus Woesearchaeota archaeon]